MLMYKKQHLLESKDTDQQQEWEQPTEAQRKDIPEEKEDEIINEEPSQ